MTNLNVTRYEKAACPLQSIETTGDRYRGRYNRLDKIKQFFLKSTFCCIAFLVINTFLIRSAFTATADVTDILLPRKNGRCVAIDKTFEKNRLDGLSHISGALYDNILRELEGSGNQIVYVLKPRIVERLHTYASDGTGAYPSIPSRHSFDATVSDNKFFLYFMFPEDNDQAMRKMQVSPNFFIAESYFRIEDSYKFDGRKSGALAFLKRGNSTVPAFLPNEDYNQNILFHYNRRVFSGIITFGVYIDDHLFFLEFSEERTNQNNSYTPTVSLVDADADQSFPNITYCIKQATNN